MQHITWIMSSNTDEHFLCVDALRAIVWPNEISFFCSIERNKRKNYKNRESINTIQNINFHIFQVNNTSLLGATHVDAVRSLRTAGDNLSLIVCDGYDEAAAAELMQENVLYNPSLVEPVRFSPDSQSSATSGDSYLVISYALSCYQC